MVDLRLLIQYFLTRITIGPRSARIPISYFPTTVQAEHHISAFWESCGSPKSKWMHGIAQPAPGDRTCSLQVEHSHCVLCLSMGHVRSAKGLGCYDANHGKKCSCTRSLSWPWGSLLLHCANTIWPRRWSGMNPWLQAISLMNQYSLSWMNLTDDWRSYIT